MDKATITPNLTFTFAADRSSAIPGDKLTVFRHRGQYGRQLSRHTTDASGRVMAETIAKQGLTQQIEDSREIAKRYGTS